VPLKNDDEIFVFPGWRSNDNTKILDRATVVVVDTDSDEVTIVDHPDAPCGYVRDGVLADDGYVYLATEAYGATVYQLSDENASPPCLLRFDPDAKAFDEDFYVDLSTLDGVPDGQVAGSLLVDAEHQPYLLVMDDSDYAGPPAARPK